MRTTGVVEAFLFVCTPYLCMVNAGPQYAQFVIVVAMKQGELRIRCMLHTVAPVRPLINFLTFKERQLQERFTVRSDRLVLRHGSLIHRTSCILWLIALRPKS